MQDGFEPDPLESFVIENTCSITTELMAAAPTTDVMLLSCAVLSLSLNSLFYYISVPLYPHNSNKTLLQSVLH